MKVDWKKVGWKKKGDWKKKVERLELCRECSGVLGSCFANSLSSQRCVFYSALGVVFAALGVGEAASRQAGCSFDRKPLSPGPELNKRTSELYNIGLGAGHATPVSPESGTEEGSTAQHSIYACITATGEKRVFSHLF